MVDYRKTLVIIAIAVLFTIFTQTAIEPFIDVNYDSCYARPQSLNMTESQRLEFNEAQEDCFALSEVARDRSQFIIFIVSAILGLGGLVAGLFIKEDKKSKQSIVFMITNGLILGGLFTIFIGTIRGWEGLHEFARPIIILAEIIIVIYVAYKRLR